ncbi:tetratricopeptide repeat protein [Kutzneria sp. CA-103260]|uniref:tetratricopeptide repeat protein n=1 Tax=Kutzneria sp. CA-103260 TaxID=2802641 RepID=UPI001BA82FC0|nr:tetratricopeptide repeat protein [Kutzneria sp. CA-103260]
MGTSVQVGVVHGGVHVHEGPSEALAVVPQQLPPVPAHFVNRTAEMRLLDSALAECGRQEGRTALALVVGPGGAGKTALVASWCRRMAECFPDGQLYADLGGFSPDGSVAPEQVMGGFVRALGVAPERVPVGLAEQAALFRSLTAGRRVLVMADNAVSAAQVWPLVPASAESMVVVTSRWRLGGVLAEGGCLVEVSALSREHSVALLEQTVDRERVRAEPDQIEALAELCGGLPIALRVAGARLVSRPRWTVSRVVAELADERRRVERLSIGGEVSVAATLDVSYHALSEPAARLYRLVSWHPGPDFGVDVAAAAIQVSVMDSDPILGELVDASLVEEPREDRYRLHDLIRLHARSLSAATDTERERRLAVGRMLAWYLDAAVAADLVVMPLRRRFGPLYDSARDAPSTFASATEALRWLESMRPHLVDAVQVAGEGGLDAVCWQLCEALWALFLQRKHFHDWFATHQVGVEAATRCQDARAEIRMRCQWAMGLLDAGELDNAHEQAVLALELARGSDDDYSEATALEHLGLIARERRQFEPALSYLQAALAIDERTGQRRGAALRWANLGETLLAAGQHAAAVEHLQRARMLLAALPDAYNEAYAISSLGLAYQCAGDLGKAGTYLIEALQAMRVLGARFQQARILTALGHVANEVGDPTRARDYLGEAHYIYTELGSPESDDLRRLIKTLPPTTERPAGDH